jgi:hypothetical protein
MPVGGDDVEHGQRQIRKDVPKPSADLKPADLEEAEHEMIPDHGFTSVDQQADPRVWVSVRDKVSAEPFYVAYKQRSAELFEPRDGAIYLKRPTIATS